MIASRRFAPPPLPLTLLLAVLLLLPLSGCGDRAGTAAEDPATKRWVPEKDTSETRVAADTSNSGDADQEDTNKATDRSNGGSKPPAQGAGKTDEVASNSTDKPADTPPSDPVADMEHPFERRLPLHEIFEQDIFPRNAEWLNTKDPLTLQDLRGKFVLLDFWTYCCINCMHVLPELKKLEREFADELVVIGVHSAKFDGEKLTDNIAAAILRYEIEHPVINDSEHQVWNSLAVRSWPTLLLIDPEGNLVWGRPGEVKAEEVATVLHEAIPYYEKKGLLNRKPMRFALLAHEQAQSPLRFPGKVLADEASGRLFISDSNHNRIVIASLDGKLLDIIGSGAIGRDDGPFESASFDHPQGCVLRGDTLYVADTENHLLRKVDLKARTVTTIAGVGLQARYPWPGLEAAALAGDLPDRWVGKPLETGLNSPWALYIHGDDLYIAMAGPHQIWKMPLDESEIGPYAGNGREDIVDGPLVPREPYALGYSSFAQPSGLTSDGTWLYVADSEGSSIRAVPFDAEKEVRTVVGTAELEGGRLFEFGDVDGKRVDVKLQHPLGVAFHEGTIYVADTYNNKIKAVDAATGDTRTVAGTGEEGKTDDPPRFDEPAGVSYAAGKLYVADTNNSLVRVVDLASGKVATLTIEGLKPPQPQMTAAAQDDKPDFSDALQEKLPQATLKPEDGKVTLQVTLVWPEGWKVNPLAPAGYYLEETGTAGLVEKSALGKKKLPKPTDTFTIELPVKGNGETTVAVSMNYYYCQKSDEGVCKIGSVVFTVPLKIADDAEKSNVELGHIVPDDQP